MSHTPLEWHLHPGAQALIGMIAAAGHQPQTRTFKNPISSHRSPQFVEERYYDCPEYDALAGIQQQAIEVAFRATLAGDSTQWDQLRGQCLATLIETEIARRGAGGGCMTRDTALKIAAIAVLIIMLALVFANGLTLAQ